MILVDVAVLTVSFIYYVLINRLDSFPNMWESLRHHMIRCQTVVQTVIRYR